MLAMYIILLLIEKLIILIPVSKIIYIILISLPSKILNVLLLLAFTSNHNDIVWIGLW